MTGDGKTFDEIEQDLALRAKLDAGERRFDDQGRDITVTVRYDIDRRLEHNRMLTEYDTRLKHAVRSKIGWLMAAFSQMSDEQVVQYLKAMSDFAALQHTTTGTTT